MVNVINETLDSTSLLDVIMRQEQVDPLPMTIYRGKVSTNKSECHKKRGSLKLLSDMIGTSRGHMKMMK